MHTKSSNPRADAVVAIWTPIVCWLLLSFGCSKSLVKPPAHGYDDIDYDIVWQIVTTDLPSLESELDRLLHSRTREEGSD